MQKQKDISSSTSVQSSNCYIDEGINPEDMIYEHLNEQQIAEYRDILEKGTASPYYIPF